MSYVWLGDWSMNLRGKRTAETDASNTPEVEVLRDVDLLEDGYQSRFLSRLVHTVVKADRYHVRVVTVIQVVPAEKPDLPASGDYDHVPACSESDEAYNA
jgi:hypothetical protein